MKLTMTVACACAAMMLSGCGSAGNADRTLTEGFSLGARHPSVPGVVLGLDPLDGGQTVGRFSAGAHMLVGFASPGAYVSLPVYVPSQQMGLMAPGSSAWLAAMGTVYLAVAKTAFGAQYALYDGTRLVWASSAPILAPQWHTFVLHMEHGYVDLWFDGAPQRLTGNPFSGGAIPSSLPYGGTGGRVSIGWRPPRTSNPTVAYHGVTLIGATWASVHPRISPQAASVQSAPGRSR